MLLLKIKKKLKTFLKKCIKWTTKFKTLTVSIIHDPHMDPALTAKAAGRMGTSLTENTGHHVVCSL